MDLQQVIAAVPLLTIAMSLVVAFISAYLTTRFALRRFYSEKWWERRAAVYIPSLNPHIMCVSMQIQTWRSFGSARTTSRRRKAAWGGDEKRYDRVAKATRYRATPAFWWCNRTRKSLLWRPWPLHKGGNMARTSRTQNECYWHVLTCVLPDRQKGFKGSKMMCVAKVFVHHSCLTGRSRVIMLRIIAPYFGVKLAHY